MGKGNSENNREKTEMDASEANKSEVPGPSVNSNQQREKALVELRKAQWMNKYKGIQKALPTATVANTAAQETQVSKEEFSAPETSVRPCLNIEGLPPNMPLKSPSDKNTFPMIPHASSSFPRMQTERVEFPKMQNASSQSSKIPTMMPSTSNRFPGLPCEREQWIPRKFNSARNNGPPRYEASKNASNKHYQTKTRVPSQPAPVFNHPLPKPGPTTFSIGEPWRSEADKRHYQKNWKAAQSKWDIECPRNYTGPLAQQNPLPQTRSPEPELLPAPPVASTSKSALRTIKRRPEPKPVASTSRQAEAELIPVAARSDHADKSDLCAIPCGESWMKVRRVYKCGHEVTMDCSELGIDVCRTLIQADGSACGHLVDIPCYLRYYLQPEDMADYCTVPCDPSLIKPEESCGHPCKGCCKDCKSGRFHIRCQEPCGRTLICGHICIAPCNKACPACSVPCELACEHGRCCQEACGYPCTPCEKPCLRECPHWKCGNKCGDVCDQEPCEEPCPKTLPCGHPCISFCGDACPDLCLVCDPDKLIDGLVLSKDFVEPTDRFVLLPDCGHAIERTMLDQWMAVQQDQVYHKACPLCGQVISQCRRYMAILCSTLADVRRVKEQLFGTRAAFLEAQKKIHELLTTPPGSELLHFADLKIYCAVVLPYDGVLVENVVYSKYNVPEMECLLDIVKIWVEAAGRVALMELHVPLIYVRRLEMMYNSLFTTLMNRGLPLHALERADLQRELNRCFDLAQLYERRSMALPEPVQVLIRTPGAQAAWTQAMGIQNRRRPYVDDLRERFREALQMLDAETQSNLGVSDQERIDIVQAIGLRPGRWFKCPNGHIYLITECGGAMEISRCPEPGCQMRIGGQDHRLVEGNRLATEMDGALLPAYPDAHLHLDE